MPKLSILYFSDNPISRVIKNYRKSLINSLPHLLSLDNLMIKPDDRLFAEAFI